MIERAASHGWFRAPVSGLLALCAALATALPAAAQDSPERFSMEVVGEGPDVILIPGLSMPRETWDGAIEALADQYRFHLLQVRGFGEPAGINAEGSPILDPLVDELAGYIAAQDLENPRVVGHSMGGLVALMLAVEHPDAAGSLLIVDALPWAGVLLGGIAADTRIMEPNIAAIRDRLLAIADEPISDAAVEAETRGIADEHDRQKVGEWMRRADLQVTAHAFYDDAMTDLRQDIARIAVPVTVLVPWREGMPGEEATLALYRMQYQAAPETRIVGIADSGHFIMLDQPDAFLRELEAYLAQ